MCQIPMGRMQTEHMPPEARPHPQMPSRFHRLQSVTLPDQDLGLDAALYLRVYGPARWQADPRRIACDPGAMLRFDSYSNLFNLEKWTRHCGLHDLRLQLHGEGQFELSLYQVTAAEGGPDQDTKQAVNPSGPSAPQILLQQAVTLSPGAAPVIQVPPSAHHTGGLVFFTLRALTSAVFHGGSWCSAQAPHRRPRLALSITTFQREEALAQTVARFCDFLHSRPQDPVLNTVSAQELHLFVVDNGNSVTLPADPAVTLIRNRNMGGAGGFARGLIAARQAGYSHCLFMDDDAATAMDNIDRSWTFLAYATDPATAVAGAMISAHAPELLWENGALFDRSCKPQFNGVDLRRFDEVAVMELASCAPVAANFYGGWWFFAFPLAEVRHLPFPFFVRGDDISFGLAHTFNTQTLNGVASLQDSFAEKDSPLTLYLDLRNHLVQHLSLPQMDIGRLATLRIALWFAARAMVPAHYDTMDALNLALADVLQGPAFFAENADMSERRATVAALRQEEVWRPMPTPPAPRQRINPHSGWQRMVMKLSLNGHLLPGFGRLGNHVVLPASQRGHPRALWGAARITYHNAQTGQGYSVRHSKRRALKVLARLAALQLRFWRQYPALKAAYQQAYPDLTTEAFWRQQLALPPADLPVDLPADPVQEMPAAAPAPAPAEAALARNSCA